MKLINKKIEELKYADYNPRKKLTPEDKEFQKIKNSIEEFGYSEPVIINKDNTIIGGHQRVSVLKELGYKDIDVIQLDLDKTKEKALNIALNKLSGEWDYDMLGELLRDLDEDGFNLDLTGFEEFEREGILQEIDIDSIVGLKEVERLRAKLEVLTNKKCIPVWHKSRGLEYWKKMCKNYDYVAIGGIVTKEIEKKDYKYFKPLLEMAKKNNCKVHGLGFTNLKELKKYDFYSVDSTSWIKYSAFGHMIIFKNGEIKDIKFKGKRSNSHSKLANHNMKQFINIQQFLDK